MVRPFNATSRLKSCVVRVPDREAQLGARTAEEYLEGLRTQRREIWVDGERVDDVANHPKLEGAARSIADYYDRQHEFADECLIEDPELGEPISVSHMVPRSKEDLFVRQAGLT